MLASAQDESLMTHAAKLLKEEGILDFLEDAETLHNKVGCCNCCPAFHISNNNQTVDYTGT